MRGGDSDVSRPKSSVVMHQLAIALEKPSVGGGDSNVFVMELRVVLGGRQGCAKRGDGIIFATVKALYYILGERPVS